MEGQSVPERPIGPQQRHHRLTLPVKPSLFFPIPDGPSSYKIRVLKERLYRRLKSLLRDRLQRDTVQWSPSFNPQTPWPFRAQGLPRSLCLGTGSLQAQEVLLDILSGRSFHDSSQILQAHRQDSQASGSVHLRPSIGPTIWMLECSLEFKMDASDFESEPS